ncbi:MAG: 4Fe-4S dicluster domain-containing protein [Dehalococcoidia bacterium]
MTQVISKSDLMVWLGRLSESHTLIAPVNDAGITLFRRVSNVEDIALDFTNTTLSPKEWFFPPTETLFSVERKDGQVELVPAEEIEESVIFGVRPCDALGIALLDRPFLNEPADALYRRHRDKTILIGLSCREAHPECFCTSMGTAPDDPSNVDVLLTEVADGYIVQAVTEKGKAILPQNLLKESEETPPSPPSLSTVSVEGIEDAMLRNFDSIYWERLADRCLHCNLCAYVCPVCYCFDVRDYNDKGKIQRVRSWESCQSRGFTTIAGGYDRRAGKGPHLRQRFSHKLLYFPREFGSAACTGCGRCVKACPVNIDIREVIADVQNLGGKSGQ